MTKYFQQQEKGGRIVSGPPDPAKGPAVVLTDENRRRLSGSPSFWKIQRGQVVEMTEAEKKAHLSKVWAGNPPKRYSPWRNVLIRIICFAAGYIAAILTL